MLSDVSAFTGKLCEGSVSDYEIAKPSALLLKLDPGRTLCQDSMSYAAP